MPTTFSDTINEFLSVSADTTLQWGAGVAVTANVSVSEIVGGPVFSRAIAETISANTVFRLGVFSAAGILTEAITATTAFASITDNIESITPTDTVVGRVVFSSAISETITPIATQTQVTPVSLFETLELKDSFGLATKVIVNAEETFRYISPLIDSQFPGFVREDGEQFVNFLRAYYEYMEENGNETYEGRGLTDLKDIDRTLDRFVEYFRKTFLANIPKNALADKRLLAKYIRNLYRSRGSQESYRFLFRALFDTEIDFYYPGEDVLRASDGRWTRETIIRVGKPYTASPYQFDGRKITGMKSGATARVQSVIGIESSGILVYEFTVENIFGTFIDGELVEDEAGNMITINNEIGAMVNFNILEGGAYHNTGDIIEFNGAGSSLAARGVVTEVTDRSAVELKLIDGGSGYRKETTNINVTGGDGTGLVIKIKSWTQATTNTAINTDIIRPMKDVIINQGRYFIAGGANTSTINNKLNGTVLTSSVSNTVSGIGTAFVTQLNVGDIVRVVGQANTLRVHTVLTNTTFISAIRPTANQSAPGAIAYTKLAAANLYSTLQNALTYSTTGSFSVNAISILNPGRDFNELPTIEIVDSSISELNLDDDRGGFLGRNAVLTTNNAPGTIVRVGITSAGANFNKNEIATMYNVSQGNSIVIDAHTGTRSIIKYEEHKTTYSGSGNPVVSGLKILPGRYTDTKGFLSWNNKLQDNFFYQEFSYVIKSTQLVDKYRNYVKNLLHPAGTKMFGMYQVFGAATMPLIVATSKSNIQEMFVVEPVTAAAAMTAGVFTANLPVVESVNLAELMVSFITKEVFQTDSITATASQDATYIGPASITNPITAADTPDATYIGPASITAVANTAVQETAIYTAVVSQTDSATATASQDATYIGPASVTETVTSTTTQVAEQFLSAPGFVRVSYANDVVGAYETSTEANYDSFVISALDGTARLVRITTGPTWFANGTLRANSGYIQVGGLGTNTIIDDIGGVDNVSIFRVNSVFSNTYLVLREPYEPTAANATFSYSTKT